MSDSSPAAAAGQRMITIGDDLVSRLAALPEATFTQRRRTDDWTAAEVVGHMTEIMAYWTRVAAAIADEPGRTFGRDLDDPDRLGAVRSANDRPRAEALGRLRDATRAAALALAALGPRAWQTEGVHVSRGPMTVGAVIETFLVQHAAGHSHQALAAAGGSGGS